MECRDVTKLKFIVEGFQVFHDLEAIEVIENYGEFFFDMQQKGLRELFPNGVFPDNKESYRFLLYHFMLEGYESTCFDLLATVEKLDSGYIAIEYSIVKGRDEKNSSYEQYSFLYQAKSEYLKLLVEHLKEIKNNPYYAEEL